MSHALSIDLRTRVLKAAAEGMSHRHAGEQFGISAASVSWWRRRVEVQGDARPKALGGDRRSGRIEACKGLILAVLAETPDITIEELRRTLAGQGHTFGFGAIRRFLSVTESRKKTGHASEQDRPDIVMRRRAWFDDQLDLDPDRLVFIDETWASTNMTRCHGRAPRGQRLRVGIPHGHWKTTTFVAGLTRTGMIAPFVLDGGSTARLSRPM